MQFLVLARLQRPQDVTGGDPRADLYFLLRALLVCQFAPVRLVGAGLARLSERGLHHSHRHLGGVWVSRLRLGGLAQRLDAAELPLYVQLAGLASL